MRTYKSKAGVRVQASSGSHVVILGMSANKTARKGLLGFAIRRTDLTEGERYWLKGMKTFKEVIPYQRPGQTYSLLEHPIQSFRWADYSAKPEHRYIYDIIPMYGTPKFLEEGNWVSLDVNTESEGDANETHDVFFNRGVAGSQAYTHKFGNRSPMDMPLEEAKKAYQWLSRGLEEALLGFIGRAKNGQYKLRASVYEFEHGPVLEAFRKANDRGADVKIVYDARKDYPRGATEEALDRYSLGGLEIPRKEGSAISHNKFIVLLYKNKPIEVWTGSTNITASGLYGQSNVGHIVRDKKTAENYLAYWKQLADDPGYNELRDWSATITPDPVGPPKKGTTTIFSPRHGLAVLEWYAELLKKTKKVAAMTAAFGVHDMFEDVLGKKDTHLRYVLLEKTDEDQEIWTRDKDVQAAVGSKIRGDSLYGWLEERTHFGQHVRYVHDKFMLIDPLSNDPIVISGSANFSAASTKINDENMLIIRGDKRVADIYFGEFMRLFSHHYFRDFIRKQQGDTSITTAKTLYLDPTDLWTTRYYKRYSVKSKERMLFSGAGE